MQNTPYDGSQDKLRKMRFILYLTIIVLATICVIMLIIILSQRSEINKILSNPIYTKPKVLETSSTSKIDQNLSYTTDTGTTLPPLTEIFESPSTSDSDQIHSDAGDTESTLVSPEVNYPFMAFLNSVYNNMSQNCGGTLIHKKIILTAAHCVDGALYVNIILGTKDLLQPSAFKSKITKYVIHKNYNSRTLKNDIALLELDEELELNEHINIVLIVNVNIHHVNCSTTVLGWALNNINDGLSATLLEKYINVINNSKCLYEIDDSRICTNKEVNGPFMGDSGGPLLFDNFQIGVVSGGDESRNIAIYTNIAYYFQWIRNQMNNDSSLFILGPFYSDYDNDSD